MSKQRSGFTLVELLAVIVILAVIALIATPAVLNIIEDSKKSAAEASARSIASAAKTHYMQNIMDNKPNSNVDLSTNTLKYDGEQAKKGLLSYDANGNVSGKMYISGYCVEVASDGNVTSEKVSIDDCNIAGSGNTSGGSTGGNSGTTVEPGEGQISFTFLGVTYLADEGMTWAEWVDSEYNTGGLKVFEDTMIATSDNTKALYVNSEDKFKNGFVRPSDTIMSITYGYYSLQ